MLKCFLKLFYNKMKNACKMIALSSSSITNGRVLFQFKNNKEPAHDILNSKVKTRSPYTASESIKKVSF